MTTIYRNYVIARLGDRFVAQSQDDECLLIASTQHRLHNAIDDLWISLDNGGEPAWFAGNSAIDLDTFGPESVPSSSDPPARRVEPRVYKVSYLMFALSAVAVAAPLSYIFEVFLFPKRVDVLLTLLTCSVAVAHGRDFALVFSVVAAFVYNFCGVDPLLTFTMPSPSEFAFLVLNITASICLPMIIKRKGSGRSASLIRRTRDI